MAAAKSLTAIAAEALCQASGRCDCIRRPGDKRPQRECGALARYGHEGGVVVKALGAHAAFLRSQAGAVKPVGWGGR